MDNSPKVS